MNCPICHHPDSSVVRTIQEAEEVRRRRECARCRHRWSTTEMAKDALDKSRKIKAAAEGAARTLVEAIR